MLTNEENRIRYMHTGTGIGDRISRGAALSLEFSIWKSAESASQRRSQAIGKEFPSKINCILAFIRESFSNICSLNSSVEILAILYSKFLIGGKANAKV